ncbi:hypothetical protein I552_9747 [Mycobacterium xenopi 3993]|nr:hypothetical protein I552_9747 [Mycobacterium xenopi 3993]
MSDIHTALAQGKVVPLAGLSVPANCGGCRSATRTGGCPQ